MEMIDIDFGHLSSELLMQNFLLVYIISFISWAGFTCKGARQVTFVEVVPHLALIIMLVQMVVQMHIGEHPFNLGSEVHVSAVTIFPVLAIVAAVFLLGISWGKTYQANKIYNAIDEQGEGANNKRLSEVDLKKLQLKAKPRTNGTMSPVQFPSIAESISAGMNSPTSDRNDRNGDRSDRNDRNNDRNGGDRSTHSTSTTTGRIERTQLAAHVAEFAQNSEVERSAMDLTTDLARQTIFAIVGLPGVGKEIADQYQVSIRYN